MPAIEDPVAAWRTGEPFGEMRLVNKTKSAIRSVHVEQAPGFRAVSSNDFFITVRPQVNDQPTVEVTFSRNTIRRVAQLSSNLENKDPIDYNNPAPDGPLGEQVIIDEFLVVLNPVTAADLAKTVLNYLSQHAPAALEVVGLRMEENSKPPATEP